MIGFSRRGSSGTISTVSLGDTSRSLSDQRLSANPKAGGRWNQPIVDAVSLPAAAR
jgi:hypothetical protein